MTDIAVVGAGELPVEKATERTLREQAIEVAKLVLTNANLPAAEVDAVFVSTTNASPEFSTDMAYGWLVEELGIRDCTMNSNVHAGGATGLNC
jgi:acetyl-CoA acetyltransferase